MPFRENTSLLKVTGKAQANAEYLGPTDTGSELSIAYDLNDEQVNPFKVDPDNRSAENSTSVEASPKPIGLRQRAESLLLIERDPDSQALAKRNLIEASPELTVEVCLNLYQAENRLKQRDFDIVVIDCELPPIDAFDFIQQLKLRDREPAVICVTETLDAEMAIKIHNFGVQRVVIRKNEWQTELISSVRHLLRIKRLEQENRIILTQLTEANKLLEEKNRRLDEFCTTLAHDIRGPLAAVSMKLDYILDVHQEELKGRLRDLLGRSMVSIHRLTDVVQAMYEYAKLGAKATKMCPIDLEQLVGEVITDLPLDESLEIDIHVGKLPNICGNPELLRRMFGNLITNGVKYNDAAIKKISITAKDGPDSSLSKLAVIEIADNGRGIAASDQREIFTLFKRGSSPNSQPDNGLGIGLAVVKRIVELHNGLIALESSAERGTVVRLTLPVGEELISR